MRVLKPAVQYRLTADGLEEPIPTSDYPDLRLNPFLLKVIPWSCLTSVDVYHILADLMTVFYEMSPYLTAGG